MNWKSEVRLLDNQTSPSVAMDVVDGVMACVLCDGAPASEESFNIARQAAPEIARMVAKCGPTAGPEALGLLRQVAAAAIERGSVGLGYQAAFSFIGIAIDGRRARLVWIGHVGALIEHASGIDLALPHVVLANVRRDGRLERMPMTARSLPSGDLEHRIVDLHSPESITLFNGIISYEFAETGFAMRSRADVLSAFQKLAPELPVPGIISLFPDFSSDRSVG